MKRTELKRKTELKRTGFKDTVRKALPKRGKKVKRDEYEMAQTKKVVRLRSGGLCEFRVPGVCTRRADHFHHRLPRRHRDNTPLNVVYICTACHNYTHAEPGMSYTAGRLLHTNQSPAEFTWLPGVR